MNTFVIAHTALWTAAGLLVILGFDDEDEEWNRSRWRIVGVCAVFAVWGAFSI